MVAKRKCWTLAIPTKLLQGIFDPLCLFIWFRPIQMLIRCPNPIKLETLYRSPYLTVLHPTPYFNLTRPVSHVISSTTLLISKSQHQF